ncbi:MAG: DUF2846 domain-containing protein [Promethearchaeota archaeon]
MYEGMGNKIKNPPSGKALVYIIRAQFKGKGFKMELKINGQHFVTTKGKKYLYIILDPGIYLLESICENKSELTVIVEADKSYYISQEVHQGTWKPRTSLKLLNEEKAYKKLEKCKLIEIEPINSIPQLQQYENQKAMELIQGGKSGDYIKGTGIVLCTIGAILSIIVGIFIFDMFPEWRKYIELLGIILQYALIIGAIVTFIGIPVVAFKPETGRIICLIGGIISGVTVITVLGAASIRKKVE